MIEHATQYLIGVFIIVSAAGVIALFRMGSKLTSMSDWQETHEGQDEVRRESLEKLIIDSSAAHIKRLDEWRLIVDRHDVILAARGERLAHVESQMASWGARFIDVDKKLDIMIAALIKQRGDV